MVKQGENEAKPDKKPAKKKEKKERKGPKKVAVEVEKPKRVPLGQQKHAIERLLLIWPSCPVKVIEQFVLDKLGVSMTRACLQEAKEELCLHTPEFSENTLKKKAYADWQLMELVQQHGLLGLSEDALLSKISKALEEQFKEKTHGRFIRRWISDKMNELKIFIDKPDEYSDILKEAKQELKKLGLGEAATGQVELL